MGKHILITGGCGFIGLNIIRHLVENGLASSIRVFDNETMGSRRRLEGLDVSFQHGDMRDARAIDEAVCGVDCVIHLAAHTRVVDSIEEPEFNFAVNVVGTMNLLQAMRRHGVAHIINASTGGAIIGDGQPPLREDMVPAPLSPYGASKLAVEGYLSAFSASYGFHACSLRFSNVYGPFSWEKGSAVAAFFRNIIKGQPVTVYGDGTQVRDFVFTKDICRGIAAAMEKEVTGVYQLGTGQPTSINQLLSLIEKTVADTHRPEIRREPPRVGEVEQAWCDITRARMAFGYEPEISLPEGLALTWKWFASQHPGS